MPIALLLAIGLGITQLRGATKPAEYQVKAAFLYKFATYIRWPTTPAGIDPNTPFVIGILGNDPFGTSLSDVVRGQFVRTRSIRIATINRVDQALTCDLLFVSSSERRQLREILEALRGTAVLTVSDIDHFAEQGGMIGLVATEDRRIHFDINRTALERAGLKAPSQLLQLARIAEETRERGTPR